MVRGIWRAGIFVWLFSVSFFIFDHLVVCSYYSTGILIYLESTILFISCQRLCSSPVGFVCVAAVQVFHSLAMDACYKRFYGCAPELPC